MLKSHISLAMQIRKNVQTKQLIMTWKYLKLPWIIVNYLLVAAVNLWYQVTPSHIEQMILTLIFIMTKMTNPEYLITWHYWYPVFTRHLSRTSNGSFSTKKSFYSDGLAPETAQWHLLELEITGACLNHNKLDLDPRTFDRIFIAFWDAESQTRLVSSCKTKMVNTQHFWTLCS